MLNIKHRISILSVIFAVTFTTATKATANWNGKIFSPGQDLAIGETEFYDQLAQANIIVIGEKHYTSSVQDMEAQIIRGSVESGSHQSNFTLGWEFLNRRDRAKTDDLFGQVKSGALSPEEFVLRTQNSPNASVYAPLIAAVRDLDGKIIPTNLSREEKSPVSQGGISALDPALLPPNYAIGGANYRQRFVDVMSNHVPANKIANYFDAQCLTDDVMAFSLAEGDGIKFLVAGSFHTDFRDGAVARLVARNPTKHVKSVSIVDASDYKVEELMALLVDPRWGALADYVVFVNEPAP